jgi:hypothetical protein
MRSTGEVMGIDKTFAAAYAKAQIAAGQRLPKSGKVFVSMSDKYKVDAVPIAQQLVNLGYQVVCTTGGRRRLLCVGGQAPVRLAATCPPAPRPRAPVVPSRLSPQAAALAHPAPFTPTPNPPFNP